MNTLSIKTLIVREYWENRGLLFKTPLIMSIILVLIASIGTYQAVKFAPWDHANGSYTYEHSDGSNFKFKKSFMRKYDNQPNNFASAPSSRKSSRGDVHHKDVAKVKSTVIAGIAGVALMISFFLSLFYLSSSLYQDRKDRSILFWRSLPIGEWETITAKLITGVWIFPLIFCGFAVISTLACMLIAYIGALTLGIDSMAKDILFEFDSYSFSTFIKIIFMEFIFTTSLLPLFCWILFTSAFSKRSPMLLSIGVPIGAMVAEGILLHSRHIFIFLKDFFLNLYFNAKSISTLDISDVNWAVYGLALLTTAVLLCGTHWLRNNRYEI